MRKTTEIRNVVTPVFMAILIFFMLTAYAAVESASLDHFDNCKPLEVDFIVLEGDATLRSIEQHIVSDLARVGITVNTRLLNRDDMNAVMVNGTFNLAFSESWGAPYDPQAFAASWSTRDEAYYAALQGLPEPNTHDVLHQKIDDALLEETEMGREQAWTEILSIMHGQATELPFSGRRIPAVINKRLYGYIPGHQQYDYPVHTIRVASGSKTLTLAPGTQQGLLSNVSGIGRLDPHTYRPNEFFSNNWVYDGLVEYGPGGTILPALAVSWDVSDRTGGGQIYTFNLRQNVKFHDGASWKCEVAKLNFDHVLAEPLRTGDYHGWYGLPRHISGWSCTSDYVLVVTTDDNYYPFLQELSFIRPLRMMSPNMFVGGLASDPLTQNSCHTGWGNITYFSTITKSNLTVQCAGMVGGGVSNGGTVSGTGRWKYIQTVSDSSGGISEIHFTINSDHWDVSSSDDSVDEIILKYYPTTDAVRDALTDGILDAVIGGGVLSEADIALFHHNDNVSVSLTESIQNRIIVFNTNRAPTNDLQNRKVIIHAIDKASIINEEFAGLADVAESLFPKHAPYCGADLTPKPDYDIEKAQLLNCPNKPVMNTAEIPTEREKTELSKGVIAVIAILGVSFVMVGVAVAFMYTREKAGNPLFQPLNPKMVTRSDEIVVGENL